MSLNPDRSSPKKRLGLWPVVRSVAGIGIGAFLIYSIYSRNRDKVDFLAEIKGSVHALLLLALMLYGVCIVLGMMRWRLLLSVQGVHLTTWNLVRLTMIGHFFNLAIPGAVSGDIIKMVYVSEHAGERTTEAVLTIFLDRVLGIFGLFLVAAAAVLLCLPFLREASLEIQVSAAVVGCGSVGGAIAVLCVIYHEPLERLPGFRWAIALGLRRLPEKITGTIGRLVKALDSYRSHGRVVLYALLLSVCVHVLLSFCIISLGRGFHEKNVQFRHFFLATQVANTVGAIPITPAGIGTRDFVLYTYMKAAKAEVAKAVVVPPFFTVVMAIWSLVGGAIFITTRGKRDP